MRTNCPRNSVKPSADALWTASTTLTEELERFRGAYAGLMQSCAECVLDEHLKLYLRGYKEMVMVKEGFERE
jgi:hypothetical protein